jgi:hypothetical protein
VKEESDGREREDQTHAHQQHGDCLGREGGEQLAEIVLGVSGELGGNLKRRDCSGDEDSVVERDEGGEQTQSIKCRESF